MRRTCGRSAGLPAAAAAPGESLPESLAAEAETKAETEAETEGYLCSRPRLGCFSFPDVSDGWKRADTIKTGNC